MEDTWCKFIWRILVSFFFSPVWSEEIIWCPGPMTTFHMTRCVIVLPFEDACFLRWLTFKVCSDGLECPTYAKDHSQVYVYSPTPPRADCRAARRFLAKFQVPTHLWAMHSVFWTWDWMDLQTPLRMQSQRSKYLPYFLLSTLSILLLYPNWCSVTFRRVSWNLGR